MDGTIAKTRKPGPKLSENESGDHMEANDINILFLFIFKY